MTRWSAVGGGLACVGGALAVAAVATRPLLWTPGSLPRYAGPGAVLADADRDLNIWILAWAARTILTDPAHLFDGNIFFPARNTLAGSESMLAHLPVTAAVWAATHDATWVLKAEMVWCVVTTGLAVFLLVRFHTGAAWAAAMAAAAVALQPGQLNPFGAARGLGAQPQYLRFQYAPLALLALGWWASRGAPAAAFGLALALALQALACFYHGYYAFLTVPFYGATLLSSRRSGMLLLGLALAGGAALVLPVARYYLEARAGGAVQAPDPRVVAWLARNEARLVLLCVSRAVKLTVVVPMGKSEPEGGSAVTARLPSTASVAVGRLKVTIAPLAEVA